MKNYSIMRLNAQWTQVLSSKKEVTISLVRLSVRSLGSAVSNIGIKIRTFQQEGSAPVNHAFANKLRPFYERALHYIDHYFGDNFYNYGLLRVAEFLDPRTSMCIEDQDGLKQVIRSLKLLVNATDAVAPGRGSRVGGSSPAASVGLASAIQARQKSPLENEVDLYAYSMVARGEAACNALCPLEFWATEGLAFPILAGVAARILSIPATSASVEQMFSISGRISCASRASLSSSHVNELCCLHQWLVDEGMASKEAASASEKRSKVIKKFAYINLRLEIEGPEVDEVSDEEGDSDGNDDIDSD